MKNILRIIPISFVLCMAVLPSLAQSVHITRTARVTFFSKTSMENIEAVNNEATSLLNTSTGELVFAVLVKSFRFEKALMEEHFNENYMESDKLPKSTFQGKITNLSAVNFGKDGSYPVTIEGDLTLHGVKKPMSCDGTISVQQGKISAASVFKIKLADYRIDVPALVSEKIAETIEIKVNCQYEPKS